jgi:hypothetical protein
MRGYLSHYGRVSFQKPSYFHRIHLPPDRTIGTHRSRCKPAAAADGNPKIIPIKLQAGQNIETWRVH